MSKQRIQEYHEAAITASLPKDYNFYPLESEIASKLQDFVETEMKIKNAAYFYATVDYDFQTRELNVETGFTANFEYERGGDNYSEPCWEEVNNAVEEEDFPIIENEICKIIKETFEEHDLSFEREPSFCSNDNQTYETVLEEETEKAESWHENQRADSWRDER